MSGSHFVARTAEGLTHKNTLVLRKLWTVVIHIDLPTPQPQQDNPDTAAPPDTETTPDNTQNPTPNTQPSDTQNPTPDTQPSDASETSDNTQNPTPDTPEFQDTYQLLSDIGLYDTTLPRSEATKEDETHLTLRFTQVIPEGTYSLYHRLPSGIEFPVFLSVPFTVLEDHGTETEEPTAETWDMPEFEADPAMTSGDEHLLHHEVDHAVLEGPDEWWKEVLTAPTAPVDSDSGQGGDSSAEPSSDMPETPDPAPEDTAE